MSAGIRNRSSRNGTATLRLPKNVTSPVSASRGYSASGTAASANHPANRMKLIDSSFPVWGKLNDAGNDDVRQLRLRASGASPLDERPARLDEDRQHDEEIAGDERGDERVAREREDVPHPDRRQRGDQSRQHPQADEQRHADVRDQVDLQAAELLEAQRAGGSRGDREQPVGREPDDEARGARQRGADHVRADRAAPACARGR